MKNQNYYPKLIRKIPVKLPATPDYFLPVVAVGTKQRFSSIAAAARWAGVWRNAIRVAVETGTRCGGYWWRYADMEARFQPLRKAKEKPVKCIETGEVFRSVAGVAGKRKSEWARLRRAIENNGTYLGFRWKFC